MNRPDRLNEFAEGALNSSANREDVAAAVQALGAMLPTDRIGVAEIERITCASDALGTIEHIQPRNFDAWNIEFPSLESLPQAAGETRSLKICIATEDIVGPVRNGGIGTTYSYLAQMLAKMGHDTTILYLRGQECENGTIEDWIAHYNERGVKFVPVPNYATIDHFQTGSNRWLAAPYNMLRFLLEHQMDVVHVSEWRGSGYLSLVAKKQKLAFANTLFVVKTSSPWLWNRLYGSQPLERIEDLAKIYAERRSVELGDVVIGGSLHLLRWMSSQGYRIQSDRTFVQPNLVSFDHLAALKDRRANAFQTKMVVDEIVFFGRLEARKGLFVFCQAIKHILRSGGGLPKKISFMGKPGARLTARPDQDVVDYILTESADWPCEVQLLTDFQQYEALDYLLSEPRLAVMPSIIENSSLAVYEAAICGIPFIASTSGGTPELVHPDDRAQVLCEAHPVPLADMISQALKNGAYVARPSFSNERNIEIWQEFHQNLGKGLLPQLLGSTTVEPEAAAIAFSACIYHSGALSALEATINSLLAQEIPVHEIIVAADVDTNEDFAAVRSLCAQKEDAVRIVLVEASDYDAGLSYNVAADRATGEFLIFMWSGTVLSRHALRALSKVARSDESDVLNFFYRVLYPEGSNSHNYLSATVLGSVSESFFHTDLTPVPLAVRAESFKLVDGFSSDYRVLGAEMEFVARAQMLGLTCTTALIELGSVAGWDEGWLRQKGYDIPTSYFRLIRPQMAAAPLALRDLLLATKGLQLKPAKAKPKAKARPAVAKPQDDERSPLGALFRTLTQDVLSGGAESGASGRGRSGSARAKSDEPALIELIDARTGQRRSKFAHGGRQAHVGANREAIPANLRRHLVRIGEERGALYTGGLLAVRDNTLLGWLRDDARPDTPVMIHVYDGDGPARLVPANLDLALATPLPGDLRRHGFKIKVSGSFLRLRLLRKTKLVRLGVGEHGDIPLAQVLVGYSSLDAAGLDGYCEISEAGRITGWAWRVGHDEAKVDVSVFVDGKFLIRTAASLHREDLADAGIGHGDHGFRIQIPKSLRDGAARRVEVFAADEGLLLKHGRMILRGDELTEIS